jgi:hypothetical protein
MRTVIAMAGVFVIGLLTATPVIPADADDDEVDLVLATSVLSHAPLTLEQGLAASAAQGNPISAKYEIEVDGLQLSVYIAKDEQLSEVIVDQESGRLDKVIPITGVNDLVEAQVHRQVMQQAKRSLQEVTAAAVSGHKGYRAVSVVPRRRGGRTVATVVLTDGREWIKVERPLD